MVEDFRAVMDKKLIKVVAMSDLHGTLPPSKDIPKCDLILIGGDICGCHGILDQSVWLHKEFKPWLENLPADRIIGVAGNHDFIWEKSPQLVPRLPWTYLQDQVCEYRGWKVFGSPWQLRFFDWAFNLDEPDLARKWSVIPEDTDIFVLHGPPKGYGDWVPRGENVGSPSLVERISQVKPRLVVYGHIHPGFGVYDKDGVTMANVSILDDHYSWCNYPTEFVLDPEKKLTTAVTKNVYGDIVERIIPWDNGT
jgi:predicted phosphohydrolase